MHIQASSRKSSRDQHEYSPQRESPRNNTPTRKASHEALSRNSALNERYFDIEKARSRSLDNLLSEPEPTPLSDLGLSQSRLNDRYHSVEQLNAPIKPVLANANYKQDLDFEYPDASSTTASNRGGPRYIKSQYYGKKAPPGSHSSRAHIEKNEFAVRSSAMSDTSEAPSLASHVRRVRVPSQASDVDQFLDELFSPVLDGNLDELSDARSLAASIKGGDQNVVEDEIPGLDQFLDEILTTPLNNGIFDSDLVLRIKGGGHRNRTTSQSSSVLDQEVEDINAQTTPKQSSNNSANVDDYISDLFKPIFINDSLRNLTEKHNLVESIKGGGTTHQPSGPGSSSFNFPAIPAPLVSSPPLMMPLLGSGQESLLSIYNMQGLGLPQNGADITAYQQNLQRAFLQSAMAQNIQIQQQLLAQNQALQQLLTQQQQSPNVSTPTTTTELHRTEIQQTVKAQIHQPPSPVQQRKSSFKAPVSSRKISSPTDYKSRKTSSESNVSIVSRNGVPPPPPMPPPLHEGDPSEARPFMDPYGRAKTVRIGKWRWPPPKDDTTPTNGEDFMHFKMRQNQRKITPNKETLIIANGHASSMHISQNSAEWEEIDFETVVREPEKTTKTHTTKRSFEVGASRPSPGSIGKLKLSSEMRQRLEQVTANHSVRSTSSKIDKPARIVNKLEDTRKMMLEQQLTGRWGSESADDNNESSGPPSPVTPAQVRAQLESKSPTQQSWTSSTWKPGPPPPPIGPSSLPPAPSMPAPPPPVRPQQQPPPPIEPIRESFMAQRQDRDTFGVHQNRTVMNNSKRNSFSANWDIQSSVTQETQDDGTSWSKDFDEKQERHARDSWDQPDSTVPSIEVNRKAMILMNDRWDSEKSFDKKNVMQEPAERPTFRSHQFSKSASRDREKKHSVSTQNTEKIEKMEGES